MTLIERLRIFRRKEIDIWDRIDRVELMREQLNAAGYEDHGHSDGKPVDRLGIKVARIVDEENAIRKDIDKHASERRRLMDATERIASDETRKIVRLYYIEAYSWDKVCCEVYGDKADFDICQRRYYNRMHVYAKRFAEGHYGD